MRRLIRLALPITMVATLAALALPAVATHPAAKHSNMDMTFISDDPFGDTNSDLAFWGDYAYVGNYRGVRIFDISTTPPTLVSTFPCDGPQDDLTVWDRDGNGDADIMFASVDSVMENSNCGAPRQNPPQGPYDPDDWEGIRIYDVSNPAAPTPIGSIYQDCGSHTHTIVPDPDENRVLLYNSSYPLRPGPTCGPGHAPDPLHSRIQVVQVSWNPANPLGPVTATEIAEPKVSYPGDPDNVFDPQAHGLPAESPPGAPLNDLRACHDIGVFLELLLAGAACAEQAQLWRLDPVTLLPDTTNPVWVFDNVADTDGPGGGDTVTDFWHSATFSWDGKIVNFVDESFGTGCPPVSPNTDPAAAPFNGPSDSGRMYFLDTSSGKELSQFMIPRHEGSGPGEYCSAHLGLTVPAAGKDLMVSAWYTGGVSVVDYTAKKNPKEVAFFDLAGPGSSGSNNWSAYWYDPTPGTNQSSFDAYGQDIGKGFERFEVFLKTSKRYGLDFLNPQTQMETFP